MGFERAAPRRAERRRRCAAAAAVASACSLWRGLSDVPTPLSRLRRAAMRAALRWRGVHAHRRVVLGARACLDLRHARLGITPRLVPRSAASRRACAARNVCSCAAAASTSAALGQ